MATLRTSWHGEGSDAQAQAQQQWEDGAEQMKSALKQLRSIAQSAEKNYTEAVTKNGAMWGVVASAHGRIDVDPDVLIDAGKRSNRSGHNWGMLCDSLSSALGSGISSGADTAGLSFALDYGRQAQDFADTLAKAANAYKAVGRMLQATGYNYKNADAGSTIGGHGAPGAVGPQPSDTVAGDMPAGPNGGHGPAASHVVPRRAAAADAARPGIVRGRQ